MPGQTPRFSVITTAFNASKYLPFTVEAVAAQTVPDWEYVLVDDGSTDDTANVIRRYAAADARIRLVQRPNGGIAAGRNTGLAAIDPGSQFVCLLDGDDVMEPFALEALADAIRGHDAAAGVHGASRYIDADGEHCRPGELEAWSRKRVGIRDGHLAEWPLIEPTTFEVLAYSNPLVVGSVLVRREVMDLVGCLDVDTAPADDWDLWLRVSLHGPIVHLNRVVHNMRAHGANLSGNRPAMIRAEHVVRHKLHSRPCLTPAQRAVVAAVYRHFHGQSAVYHAGAAARLLRSAHVPVAAREAGRAAAAYGRYLRAKPVWKECVCPAHG